MTTGANQMGRTLLNTEVSIARRRNNLLRTLLQPWGETTRPHINLHHPTLGTVDLNNLPNKPSIAKAVKLIVEINEACKAVDHEISMIESHPRYDINSRMTRRAMVNMAMAEPDADDTRLSELHQLLDLAEVTLEKLAAALFLLIDGNITGAAFDKIAPPKVCEAIQNADYSLLTSAKKS